MINKLKLGFFKKTVMFWWMKILRDSLLKIKYMDVFHTRCKIENHGTYSVNKHIKGGGKLYIGHGSMLDHVEIRIVGQNNSISIGKGCYLGKRCSLWLEGNNISITIGDRCTFTHDTQLCAQEDNCRIEIGNDCMFSHHINVRTSDSHLIFDTHIGERVNYPKNVIIGAHVWIAPEAKIMKGCTIGRGAIIGSNTIVTKDIPPNSLAVGMPAKVVKSNVSWSRDKLF